MFITLKNRLQQGSRTMPFPDPEIRLPAGFRGRPRINRQAPAEIVRQCAAACPQEAIDPERRLLHLGRCVFCGRCQEISAGEFVTFSADFDLAVADRQDLYTDGNLPDLAGRARARFKKLFGRSLCLRQVSAGGCNACEADTNVLNTPAYDLSRFGIQFVASPRHADGLHITGPVTRNMKTALLKTYEAVPGPKVVIAAGSCALSGGPFYGSPECLNLEEILPVDLYIPGCPPHPLTTLAALLKYFK